MKRLFTIFFACLLSLCFIQCLEEPSLSPSETVSPNTQNQGGVSVGNPTDSPKKAVQYSTAHFTLDLSSDTSRVGPGYKNVPGTCFPFSDDKNTSQLCRTTPAAYSIRISKIELLECATVTGESKVCGPNSQLHLLNKSITLYEGPAFDIELKIGDSIQIPVDLNPIEESIKLGGVRLTIEQIKLKLPEPTQGIAAKFITTDLHGKEVKLCYASDSILDQADMEELCEVNDVKTNDVLFDLNLDGKFSYLAQDDGLYEKINRDFTDYKFNLSTRYGFGNLTSLLPGNNSISSSIATHREKALYSPVFSLNEMISIDENSKTIDLNGILHVGQLIQFIDGPVIGEGQTKKVCVKNAVDADCSGDDDPLSTGVFDPKYDNQFMIITPRTELKLK